MLNSNICNEKEFNNVAEKNIVKKKVTTQDVEKWEVAQLECNIEPSSKPTDLFEKLEEKRKVRHENLLKQLAKNLHDVNLKTEKNIKISSEELKAHIKNFNNKLQDMLKVLDVPEIVSYCSSVFIEYQNEANECKSHQIELVNELYEDLIRFENERAEESEKLLKLSCEEMRKIGYFFPYEIQTFVEHETLKMNQLSLNNRRCYEDLKLTLTLVTELTYKSFMDKVFCIREKWVQFKLQENFYNLQNRVERKIAKLVPETCARLEMKGQELVIQCTPNNLYSTCKVEEWSRNVEEVVATIGAYGKSLINIYKKTLNAVFHGFNSEVEEIKAELNLVDTLAIEQRIIKPIIFEAQNDQMRNIDNLEIYWQNTLEEIEKYVKEVTEFLLDAGKLWDKHTERICESKKLILKALEKAEKNNQAVLQDLEIKLNISFDALRQEHNQSKLEKAYEAVIAMLKSLKAKYESMYLEDISIIEDFYKMMDLEADVLSAEIKEFIHEIHVIEHGRVVHCHTERRRFPEGKPLFKEIQMCAQQIQAIRCWKQGVWVALESLSEKTRETLRPRAESWISKKIETVAEKKTVQLELLEKRFQRIRFEIYEKRLMEIETHQRALENHKKKIEFELTKMKEDFKNLISKELNKMNFVKENMAKIEANAMVEDRPGVIRGNQIMMEKKKEELENELKMTFDKFRVDCETKISDIKQANINFMKSIKLFHENGNYSSEEGKMFINSLEVVDKDINAGLKNIVKDSTKEENDLIKKLLAIFNPLIALFSLLHEETLFNLEVRQRLQYFTSGIQDSVKTLKLDFDFLKNQCYCLCKALKNTQHALDDIDEKFWNFIIQLLYRNVSNLLYPINVPETPVPSMQSEEKGEGSEEGASIIDPCCCGGKFSLHITHSNTYTFRTLEKDDAFTCKDYKNQLFNCKKPPENDGTFLVVMCNNFWTEMEFFQRAACNFYKHIQGRKIIREDLISANYDIFVGEILLKFRYYHTQIEQLWFKIIIEFLTLLGAIKSLANEFLERKVNEYEILAFKVLKDLRENFLGCITSLTSENSKEREALDNRLLPLHGYPHNADLLNELEEEVVRKISNQEIKMETAIKHLKNQLKCYHVHYIEKKFGVDQIEVFYFKLRDKIFVDNMGEKLLDFVLDYCDKREFCIKKTLSDHLIPKKNESTILTSAEIPEEYKLSFESVDENLQSVETYVKELKQIIERERTSDVSSPARPPSSRESFESLEDANCPVKLCEPKLNILLKHLNFEERVLTIEENLKSSIRLIRSFADSQTNSLEEELFRWLTKWKISVKKILKLYRVKYEEKPDTMEVIPSENNKPKTEKTSASETLTLPRLCPTTKLDIKVISCNIPKLKSRSLGSKPSSDENNKPLGATEYLKTNLQKSKLTEFKNSGQVRLTNNASSFLYSPRNYHGQIPVLHRRSLNLIRMSPPDTRSPSPLKKVSPKEKSVNKIKTITLDQDSKKKSKTDNPRSPSPVTKTSGNYKKSKSRSSTQGNFKSSEKMEGVKFEDSAKNTSPSKNSLTNKKSKAKVLSLSNLEYSSKSKSGKELQKSVGDSNSIILKQVSQPSLCMNEKIIQPKEKISLDHIKNGLYPKDHRRLSFEKVHLCIEKSDSGEKKRSYLVKYTSEDLQKPEDISLAFLQNLSSTSIMTYSTDGEKRKIEEISESKTAIETLSGHEFLLAPSVKLDIEKGELVSSTGISDIFQDNEEGFKEQKEVHIPQDDANEYDSEVSTDGEVTTAKRQLITARISNSKCNDLHRKSTNSLWKSREADLLNDVDYRQSVYHPAVSRRPKIDDNDLEFRQKSKSVEDNFEFSNKTMDPVARSRSPNLKNKYTSPGFTTDKMDVGNDRSWVNFDKTDGKSIYNFVFQDVPFYGMKRIRTKKERISGALLHFTLKVIRLLAIFNLWPGDNCHMLTLQSLRFAR